MLYLDGIEMEACRVDKERIHMVCPATAVHLILSGKGYFNGRLLGPGDGFITRRNDLVDYLPDREDPWQYLWFRLGGNDSEGILQKTIFPGHSGAFRDTSDLSWQKIAQDILAPQTCFSPDQKMKAEAYAKLLCACFEKKEGTDTEEVNYVECAKRRMKDSLHRQIKVEELAAELHITRKYLTALFVRQSGISPKQYLGVLRLERAKELLENTPYPIGNVANAAGYSDMLAFSRFFRKHIGCSPSEYRKKTQGCVGGVKKD